MTRIFWFVLIASVLVTLAGATALVGSARTAAAGISTRRRQRAQRVHAVRCEERRLRAQLA